MIQRSNKPVWTFKQTDLLNILRTEKEFEWLQSTTVKCVLSVLLPHCSTTNSCFLRTSKMLRKKKMEEIPMSASTQTLTHFSTDVQMHKSNHGRKSVEDFSCLLPKLKISGCCIARTRESRMNSYWDKLQMLMRCLEREGKINKVVFFLRDRTFCFAFGGV